MAAGVLMALGASNCGSSRSSTGDAAAPVKCPLAADLTFLWIGRTSTADTHRLVPPASYQRWRSEALDCSRRIPDCNDATATVHLGHLAAALGHPDVTASWPGTGQKLFTFDSANAEELTFEVESSGQGTIVLSPHCDRTGCNPPPSGVVTLAGTLHRLVAELGCP
jgi:hypothetical protein